MRRTAVNRLGVLLFFLLCAGRAAAAPVVINEDTVWSGKVLIDDIVAVNAQATLTIRPGTEILFAPDRENGLLFVVYGAVIAEGVAGQPVVFTSAGKNPQPGDWQGIYLEETRDRESLFRHCRIEFAAVALGGVRSKVRLEDSILRHNRIAYRGQAGLQGAIVGCEVTGNATGLDLEKSDLTRVEHSRLADNHENGIQCLGTSPQIRGNLIERNGGAGIFCRHEASPVIEGNLIRANGIGIRAERQVAPSVLHNDILENDTGVWLEKMAFPRVEQNVIRGNRIGVYCNLSGYPLLRGNNIVGNRELALDLGPQQSIEVSRSLPYRQRTAEFAAGGTAGPKVIQKNRQERFDFAFPENGRIDARHNWWGEEGLAVLTARGAQADLDFIEDGHDEPESEFEGKTYPRDRFAYAPWATAPIADAGLTAPAGPPEFNRETPPTPQSGSAPPTPLPPFP